MIDATHVDVRAAVEQEVGDREGLRLMQWLLTISSSRVHERGVGAHHRSQFIEPAKSCRHVRRQLRATRQKKPRRPLVRVIEHSIRAVLPVAFQVDVSASLNQRRQQPFVFRGHVGGSPTKVEHRIVEPLPHVGEREEPLRSLDISLTHGVAERLYVALLQFRDEFRPRVKASLAGDRQLGIGKLERARW